MTTQPTVRFGVININHGHIYGQVRALLRGGAEFVTFYAGTGPAAPFAQTFPQAAQVSTPDAILKIQRFS